MLSRAEWTQLLPAQAIAAKASWTVPPPVAARLAEWVYPQKEATQNRSRIEKPFRLTAVSVQAAGAGAHRCKIRLIQFFIRAARRRTYRQRSHRVPDFDLVERRIQRLRIVTGRQITTTRPLPRRWSRCPAKRSPRSVNNRAVPKLG